MSHDSACLLTGA
ncbi:uncharacterized protein FFFS_15878 [Fusarium fujikuroi]|nr:uncharacterized protein FFFS_15878 [Fusarium fujikuroi]